MDTNPYAAPESLIISDIYVPKERFYVVAPRKFLVLFFSTVGIYQLYWVYKHWSQFKKNTKGDEWPVMRAIFPVFFTHSLFLEIDHTLRRVQGKFSWKPGVMAAVAIVAMIVGNLLDRASQYSIGSPGVDIASLFAMTIVGYCLYRAQLAANIACGDPEGDTNSSYGAANIVWIILGLALWMMALLGLYMMVFPESFPE
jgi:hypothetical protein